VFYNLLKNRVFYRAFFEFFFSSEDLIFQDQPLLPNYFTLILLMHASM